jgi:hypothetical protein
MSEQGLVDPWGNVADPYADCEHATIAVSGDEGSGWTVEWVFRVLLAPRRVRASHQEAEALQNFECTQREEVR